MATSTWTLASALYPRKPLTLRRYFALFAPHYGPLAVAGVLLVLASAIPAVAVLLLRSILSEIETGADVQLIILASMGFGALYLGGSLLQIVRTWVTKRIGWAVASKLRCQTQGILLAKQSWDPEGTGILIAALTAEVDEVQYGVSAIITAIRNPLTLIGLGCSALWLAPWLAFWGCLFLPCFWAVGTYAGRRMRRSGRAWQDQRASLTQLIQEQLTGRTVIQANGSIEAETRRFEETETSDRKKRIRMEVERTLPSAVSQAVSAAGVSVLLIVGTLGSTASELVVSDLVGFIVAVGLMARPIAGLTESWGLLQRSLVSLARVESMIHEPVDWVAGHNSDIEANGNFWLEWENVGVQYGEKTALTEVYLSVAPGVTAVVGATGSGKTTLAKCGAGLLQPQLGSLSVRQETGETKPVGGLVHYLSQDGFLFSRSIRDNLTMGRKHITEEAIWAALQCACARELVQSTPMGLDTVLRERGQDLSGGERQRLCVARALLTNRPILILDEPTNHLDADTETRVIENIRSRRAGSTTIIVAHHLHAISKVDEIVVFESGRKVQQGTHTTLLSDTGCYARLWAAQN